MKKILVIHTGGTISMIEDASGSVVEAQATFQFPTTFKKTDNIQLIVEIPFQLPSPHITPKEMLLLKTLIEEKIDTEQIHGVVITHGTDTLEETAYFLDLTLTKQIPVVLTGAMRSSNEIGADGLANFLSAIKVAAANPSKEKGVLVVMNDEIHAAKNVTKTHTSNLSTFQSPQYGPIGMVTKKDVLYHHQPLSNETYSLNHVDKNIFLLKAYAGFDTTLLMALAQLSIDGLVIEALGQGNLPPQSLAGMKTLLGKHIPIVLVSRCFNGIVEDIYAYEGGGKQLKQLGVIFSNGLNGQKARIKLLIALASGQNLKNLQKIFMI